MKIIQLIDSLRPGGAEQMAVSYANALSSRIKASFLCCTRKEGLLKEKLAPEVEYLFLNKKGSLDPKAFLKFRKFVKKNEIDIVHAHSSSFFLAVLIKWTIPKLKVIWHDHFGRDLKSRKAGLLIPFSRFFAGVISVNRELKRWARKHFRTKRFAYIPNFLSDSIPQFENSSLNAQNTFKIICVANFRTQKNHLNLLVAFKKLQTKNAAISLHLIGKGEDEAYSEEIKKYIRQQNLQEHVFLYGGQLRVESFLKQADLGVLSSTSEGLPLALLEYGKAGLPVVCTNVGQCAEVIEDFGRLVPPKNPTALAEAMTFYMENDEKRKQDATRFHNKIMVEYSENAVMPEVLQFYKEVIGDSLIG